MIAAAMPLSEEVPEEWDGTSKSLMVHSPGELAVSSLNMTIGFQPQDRTSYNEIP